MGAQVVGALGRWVAGGIHRLRRRPVARRRRILVAIDQGAHTARGIARAAGLRQGAIYPDLARLELDGYITSRWHELDRGGPVRWRQRRYYLTMTGRHVLLRGAA